MGGKQKGNAGRLRTNEDIHGMRGRRHNHADDDQSGTSDGDVAAAHEIGHGADEGAHRGEGEEVAENEPDPSVGAANLSVDVGWDSAEEVDGELGAGPEEGHGDEGHQALEGQLWVSLVSPVATRLCLPGTHLGDHTGGSCSWSASSPYVLRPPFS